jgi:hypothetical protein
MDRYENVIKEVKKRLCGHLYSKYPISLKNLKMNLFLLKYGSILHTVFFLSMLIYMEITPKTPAFWAFLLNHIMFSYFVFIRGCALGISKTIDAISINEASNVIQEDINKNN